MTSIEFWILLVAVSVPAMMWVSYARFLKGQKVEQRRRKEHLKKVETYLSGRETKTRYTDLNAYRTSSRSSYRPDNETQSPSSGSYQEDSASSWPSAFGSNYDSPGSSSDQSSSNDSSPDFGGGDFGGGGSGSDY